MEVLISILPVIIILSVVIYFMIRLKNLNKSSDFNVKQDKMICLLEEIKNELKVLNKNNSDK